MTDKQALRQHLEASRQQLLAVVDQIQETGWQKPVQVDGERWTALQMIRHLQDAHKGLTAQLERMIAGQETVPADFDIDRWNARIQGKTTDMTPEQALETLKASHAKLLSVVDNLKEEDFARSGYQAGVKRVVSLEEFINIIGLHEQEHTRDLKNALS